MGEIAPVRSSTDDFLSIHTEPMIRPVKAIISFFNDKAYRNLTLSMMAVLLNGTVIYHYLEDWRWFDAFYFSVITLSTVGYGDFSPQTDAGKLFTIVYIFTGIGIIFGYINLFYKRRTQRVEELQKRIAKLRKKHKKASSEKRKIK